jgi:oligopeptidase B
VRFIKDAMYPAAPAMEWANDSKTLFYTENNPQTLLTEKIKKHLLGTESKDDKTVYEENDKSNYLYLGKLRSKKFIVINSAATMSPKYFTSMQANQMMNLR